MAHPDPVVSTAKAAAAVGVDRTTLFRWYQSGKVTTPYVTPSKHLRWDIADLHRQLAGEPSRLPAQSPTSTPEDYVPEPADEPEHQPVVAAVVTSRLGVLAGRRNDGKPPWTFIAGEIEPGESQLDAAVREVKEETGLEVATGRQEIGRRVHPKTGRTMVYLPCTPTSDPEGIFVGDPEELAEVRWLSLAEVDELMPGVYPPVRAHLGRLIS